MAGDGVESEEVTFSTNGEQCSNVTSDHMIPSSAPQPPMEILTTATTGVVNIVTIGNQSVMEEAGFSNIFTTDNRNYIIYYTDIGCSKVLATSLRNPQNTKVSDSCIHQAITILSILQVIANTMTAEGSVVDITYDWFTRVLYLAVNDSGALSILRLPIDNPVVDDMYTVGMLANGSVVSIAIVPFTG